MHDPTEGGIATACWELAQAAEVGLRVERERIPVFPEGEWFCREFGLDPLGTIASGALLLTLAPADAALVLHACAREGIDCAFVGQVVPKEEGVVLVESGRSAPMPLFPQDEITKIFRER
jgi:hydrogenase maturation factor